MAEHRSLLTDEENAALEIHEAMPRARALEAWMAYAALNGIDTDRLVAGVERIRGMTKKQLKKVRKSLAAATRVPDFMPMAIPEMSEEGEPSVLALVEPLESRSVQNPEDSLHLVVTAPRSEEEEIDDRQMSEQENLPIDDVAEREDLVSGSSELAESSRAWVLKLIPDYIFDGKSVEQIAEDIYDKMGRPQTRKQPNGHKIDPINRIIMRLEGNSNSAIAQTDQVSADSVHQWFYTFVEKRFSSNSAQQEQASAPSKAETDLDSDALLKAHFANRKPLSTSVEINKDDDEPHELLADRFAEVADFDSLRKAAFFGYINPHPRGKELTLAREQMIASLRNFVEKTIAPLPQLLEHFKTNERTRMQQLFGVKVEDGKVTSMPKLQHVDMLEHAERNGLDKAKVTESLFSALEKLADMLEEAVTNPAIAK